MTIKFELPPDVEQKLRQQLGDLDEVAKDAFLVQNYRDGRLSVGQIADILGKGVIETQAWLSERGTPLNYSVSDLEEDRRTLAKLLPDSER